MTLQIRSTDMISGIPIKKVRGFFRHLVSGHQHSFELLRLQQELSLERQSALALVTEWRVKATLNRRRTACTPFQIKERNWFGRLQLSR